MTNIPDSPLVKENVLAVLDTIYADKDFLSKDDFAERVNDTMDLEGDKESLDDFTLRSLKYRYIFPMDGGFYFDPHHKKVERATGRGGWRGGGRPKVEGGVRRMWTVPPDVDAIVQERGTKFVWEAVRFKLAFERMQENK